jgi:hypothetical protein
VKFSKKIAGFGKKSKANLEIRNTLQLSYNCIKFISSAACTYVNSKIPAGSFIYSSILLSLLLFGITRSQADPIPHKGEGGRGGDERDYPYISVRQALAVLLSVCGIHQSVSQSVRGGGGGGGHFVQGNEPLN